MDKNWLCDCRQRVEVTGSYSLWRLVPSGALQSLYGKPILFNIFISDLQQVMDCTYIKFGDDMKLERTSNRVKAGLPCKNIA